MWIFDSAVSLYNNLKYVRRQMLARKLLVEQNVSVALQEYTFYMLELFG